MFSSLFDKNRKKITNVSFYDIKRNNLITNFVFFVKFVIKFKTRNKIVYDVVKGLLNL